MHARTDAFDPQLKALLRDVFGHAEYRPHQREVCESIAGGNHVLLVMPTGAGKSLCYQLPGLYRSGTTLVLSPLIALMEDQVASLRALGLKASAIHSGRSRQESRDICLRYLSGQLDYLYVAPERLGVTGFAEFLGRRKPGLIAIDEAHCISQWGHDFRPDYRLLHQRLPLLMPTPIVALTATATPQVQQDIIAQLGVSEVQRFVHGFRRENLAVEVCELPPAERSRFIRKLLSRRQHLPAIVYAPTRRESESIASCLENVRAQAYHAGMDPRAREHVQRQFSDGALDVVVATVAFGMGIDKSNIRTVVHSALPASIENYYQEIGRAGRDQEPARAILLHSFADVKTQLWLRERDYPEPSLLERVFTRLRDTERSADDLAASCGLDVQQLSRCLEKLILFQGCRRLSSDGFVRGREDWLHPYLQQREQKQVQLKAMTDYSGSNRCRMLALVRHFGDQEDSGVRCGRCDICRPEQSLAAPAGPPNPEQTAHFIAIISALRFKDGQAIGTLHKAHELPCSRQEFQALIAALNRAQLLDVDDDEFEKDGNTIRYQRIFLTTAGHRALLSDLSAVKVWSACPRLDAVEVANKHADAGEAAPERERMLAAVRAWRTATAQAQEVPAYRILSNQSLRAIVEKQPTTLQELSLVKGIGRNFVEEYGPSLLSIL